ncbi:MAG: hypothetical protein GY869_27005, partial [Planctomycetes bacterium]|nr:hypothetical protein [Planctomycetota bacterium]
MTDDKFLIIWNIWLILSLAGMVFWLYRSCWGRKAFLDAPEQRHRLGGIDLLFVISVYFVAMAVRQLLLAGEEPESEAVQDMTYLGLAVEQLVVSAAILVIAQLRFSGGLGGFGLSLKKPGRTAGWTVIYFLIATGLTFITLQITLSICQMVGIDEVQKHETLQKLLENPSWQSTMLLVVTAVVGAPL